MKLHVKAKFDAAHFLPGHHKCGKIHGHTYHLTATFEGKKNISNGMVVGFATLKRMVTKYVVKVLDHKHLNELVAWDPTAENIAVWIYNVLKTRLEQEGMKNVKIVSVELWETESCGVTYP